MASFNKVFLLGNLTRDPELKVTTNGHSICKFGIAVTRVFSGQDGNQREETTFVDVDSFGRQAETISKYMVKGRPIFIEGRLRLDQWETKDGEKRSKLCVVLETFQFLNSGKAGGQSGSGEEGEGNQYSGVTPPARESNVRVSAAAAAQDIDEDVPF